MSFKEETLTALAAAEPLVHHYLIRSELVEVFPSRGEPLLVHLDLLNSGWQLIISTDFHDLPMKQQLGLLVQQYLKLFLRHLDKRSRGTNTDSWLANTAQEMALNPHIVRQYELPKSAIFPNSHGYSLPPFESTEFYFNELLKDETRAQNAFPISPIATFTQERESIADLAREFQDARPNSNPGTLASTLGSPNIVQQIIAQENAEIWYDAMDDFWHKASASNRSATWKRPSRRISDYPLGHKTNLRSVIPVILDTSASMKDCLSRAVAAIHGLSAVAKTLLVQCDTSLTDYAQVEKGLADLEVVGGGGTNLQAGFDWVQQKGFSYCVCISDQEFVSEPDTYGLQVKWWNPKTGELK